MLLNGAFIEFCWPNVLICYLTVIGLFKVQLAWQWCPEEAWFIIFVKYLQEICFILLRTFFWLEAAQVFRICLSDSIKKFRKFGRFSQHSTSTLPVTLCWMPGTEPGNWPYRPIWQSTAWRWLITKRRVVNTSGNITLRTDMFPLRHSSDSWTDILLLSICEMFIQQGTKNLQIRMFCSAFIWEMWSPLHESQCK